MMPNKDVFYQQIVGTGGVGTGMVYEMEGNHPMGKSESRKAFLKPYKDFCKIHIILHYVSLLIKELKLPVAVIPLSAVGNDQKGKELLQLMGNVGMKLDSMHLSEEHATLSCVCQNYPDGSSSNFTEGNSACDFYSIENIKWANNNWNQQTLFVAAPEVPLEIRLHLLAEAKKGGAFTLASFTSGELLEQKIDMSSIDVLLFNKDETYALVGAAEDEKLDAVFEKLENQYQGFLSQSTLISTLGGEGVCLFEKGVKTFVPVIKANPVNTAGAGDAFLSGLLFGLLLGMPLYHENELCGIGWGLLFSRISIESVDTIALEFDLNKLIEIAQSCGKEEYASYLSAI